MSDFDNYYRNQALRGYGATPTFHKGQVFFKGHGTFGNVMSSILNISKPFMKKAGAYLGKKALKTVGNVATDVIGGTNLGTALKRNASKAFESTKDDVSSILKNKLQYSPATKRKKKNNRKRNKRRGQSKKRSNKTGYL